MKFEIANQENIKQERPTRAWLEIDKAGDLLLFIDDILIAHVDCVLGELIRRPLSSKEVNRLKCIGIMTYYDGHTSRIKAR